jgi:peptide/nickel transport system permease protein
VFLLVALWLRRGLWVGVFLMAVIVLTAETIVLSQDYHILGTDKTGQDVLYIALKSVRTGLIIGTLTTLIVTPFAILCGVLAGYFGGWMDDIIQYVYTTLASIPDILLIAAAMLIFQVGLAEKETIVSADERLVYLCVIMGITSWTGLCRLIRGEVLKLREIEYVQAADAFGVSQVKIMLQHLVPNIMHIVLISIVLRFSGLVLAEAVLAYVGIGVDPSMQSWGNMINQARLELARDPVVWWNLFAAFVFMLGLVLPANIFGDAVRDALDPRLRTQ